VPRATWRYIVAAMDSVRVSAAAFGGMAVSCAVQGAWYYPRLPDFVASHFSASGAQTAWMPKSGFLFVYAAAILLVGLVMLAAAHAPGTVPDHRINLPHREYWLAPERRAETLGYFKRFFFWFGAATYALFFDIFGQAFRVALGQIATLQHPGVDLALYAAFVLLLVGSMFRRFGRVPAAGLRG
jgi:Protein of unknown function (DUF1648)